jgi:hypothetical protein
VLDTMARQVALMQVALIDLITIVSSPDLTHL